jgi:four helix bundle protein
MGQFEDLAAWQKSHELAWTVYRHTGPLPDAERFDLTSQRRCAAVSVPSNIAEGWGRATPGDCVRHPGISRASLYDLFTQTRLASDRGYLDEPNAIFDQLAESGRILSGLIRSLSDDDSPGGR